MPDPRRSPDAGNTVNSVLTRRRGKRRVENDDYIRFIRRVMKAYALRIADGDIDALIELSAFLSDMETIAGKAVTGLRAQGYSWAEIGLRLGVTRQAAQQRWGDAQP